jgi:hypothetical protein
MMNFFFFGSKVTKVAKINKRTRTDDDEDEKSREIKVKKVISEKKMTMKETDKYIEEQIRIYNEKLATCWKVVKRTKHV